MLLDQQVPAPHPPFDDLPEELPAEPGPLNTAVLKQSWAYVAANGAAVAEYFYDYLFDKYPQTRPMFPERMEGQRDKLTQALVVTVANVDQLDRLVPVLQDLGRRHVAYGVVPAHYPVVGEVLLATLKHFHGDTWTAELEDAWATAFGIISQVMIEAANEAVAGR